MIKTVFEKLIVKQVTKLLVKYDILTPDQPGFHPNKLTSTAVTYVTNYINTCLNNDKIVIGTLLDIKKAFDTAGHHTLLKKLQCYRF